MVKSAVRDAPSRVRGCWRGASAPPLPDATADELAAVYKALADPTRIQMLHMLSAAEETDLRLRLLTAAFDLGQRTVSHTSRSSSRRASSTVSNAG